jgi:hypothetical protein
MQVQCCVCKKLRVGRSWVKPSEDVSQHDLSHGYCPACLDKARKEIQALRFQMPPRPLMLNR